SPRADHRYAELPGRDTGVAGVSRRAWSAGSDRRTPPPNAACETSVRLDAQQAQLVLLLAALQLQDAHRRLRMLGSVPGGGDAVAPAAGAAGRHRVPFAQCGGHRLCIADAVGHLLGTAAIDHGVVQL